MKKVKINNSFFKNNRQKIIKDLNPGSVAIIHANDELNRTGDQHFPYRQNSDFF